MGGDQGTERLAGRTDGLVITQVQDETLVYDPARQHIHHLNETMTVRWRLCNGQRTVTEVHRDAQFRLGAPTAACNAPCPGVGLDGDALCANLGLGGGVCATCIDVGPDMFRCL